jgi:hypothetical protein
VWDPYREGSKRELEAVHRRAARRITGVYNERDAVGVWNSATHRVNQVGLETLEFRRKVERLYVCNVQGVYHGARGWEEIQRKLVKSIPVCAGKTMGCGLEGAEREV